MLHLKLNWTTGSSRRMLYDFMKRYQRVLVICAPTLRLKWANVVPEFEAATVQFTAITRDEFLLQDCAYSEYDLIVIEDYPMMLHAPRRRYDSVSYLGHILDQIGNNHLDVLQID